MPPTANVVSVAGVDACAAAVGLETDCGTPPSHAAIARLAVINTARMRFIVHRFHSAPSGRFQASVEPLSSTCPHLSKRRTTKKGRGLQLDRKITSTSGKLRC